MKQYKKANINKIGMLSKLKIHFKQFGKYFIAFINMIAALASIIGLVISIATKEKMAVIFYSCAGVIIISVLFTIFTMIRSGRSEEMKDVNKLSKGYHEILHLIRDCYGDLLEVIEDDTYKEPTAFRKYMTEKVMAMMDLISKYLTDATGYPVRACIKTYDFLHKENCTKVITLARSGQLNVNNMISEHFVQIDINDNTDFKLVFRNNVKYVGDRENYFFINDLIKYSKDNEYKNSNDKWKEYYTTTVVMPIRYLKNPKKADDQTIPHYNIIGCLCIDSKKTNLFAIKEREFIIEYLKGVTDILYMYLNECIQYHNKLRDFIDKK